MHASSGRRSKRDDQLQVEDRRCRRLARLAERAGYRFESGLFPAVYRLRKSRRIVLDYPKTPAQFETFLKKRIAKQRAARGEN